MKSIRKLWLAAVLIALSLALLPFGALAKPELPCPYEQSAPGTFEFVIPRWAVSITVEAYGGGGGGAGGGGGLLGNPESPMFLGGPGGAGGSGGYVTETQPISRSDWGRLLSVSVGQGGAGGSGGNFDWGEFMPMWYPPTPGSGGGQSSVTGPGWTVAAQGGAGGLVNEVPGSDGEGYYEGQPQGHGGAGGDINLNGLPGGNGYVKITYVLCVGAQGTLTVNVVKTDGTSVDHVPVSIGGAISGKIHANSSGVAKLNGLRAGRYEVNASADGYSSNGPKIVVLETKDSDESVTIVLTPVPATPPPPGPGSIEGTAGDETTGVVLPGVFVRLLDSTDTIVAIDMTDQAGVFGFEGLAPGSYTVRGSLEGYGVGIEDVVVTNDETTMVELRLAAGIVAPTTPPATGPIVTPPDLPKTGAGRPAQKERGSYQTCCLTVSPQSSSRRASGIASISTRPAISNSRCLSRERSHGLGSSSPSMSVKTVTCGRYGAAL